MKENKKVQKLCNSLERKDPNFLKYLKNININTKSIILKVANETKRKEDSSTSVVISELILRYFNLKPSPLQKIKGPSILTVMEHDELPQIFYLFGEAHGKYGMPCENSKLITDFIKDIIHHCPVFVDVYLETPYKHRGYLHSGIGDDNYLKDLEEELDHCVYLDKSDKASLSVCNTTRVHFVDVRRSMRTTSQLHGMVHLHHGFYNALDKWGPKELKEVTDYLTYIQSKDTIIYKKIKKQFENIVNLNTRLILENGFDDCIKHMSDVSLFQMLPSAKKNVSQAQKMLKDVFTILVSYSNCLMDYYLIARIFRDYKRKSNNYSWASYNNIVYSGNMHTTNYINILKALGFKIKTTIECPNYEEQCLDVSKMKPFFHQRY
jgi:hypothetical protein